ncbi:carbohydrate ABC transporter permease [Paenibacillus flagellatus]|uniref:ABC transporter permease n=1 Tax=Paenibacillus flagellatus TaxID=2211139 RepID=A0A2V5KCI2_9BACL|nr:carbohydrate ABC transporter permease [Paenibacillus flagellatus]PYI57315.1 ABC transporter permease [Paenibacillus flagellatus]
MSFVIHKTRSERVADAANYTVLALFALATLFPVYYVFIMSVTPYTEVLRNGGFIVLPAKMTLLAYQEIFSSERIPDTLLLTIKVTVIGTLLSLAVTTLLAYPLSKKSVPGRSAILMAIVFTMLFSGGIIPLYLVVRELGIYNTMWALIIPGAVSTFNFLIMKTYFEGLPQEVEEAARVDGCSDISTLIRIVLPLSAPILATVGLFYGVSYWNEYFKGIIYITDRELYPMQVVLRNMIQTPSVSQELSINSMQVAQLPPETVRMATVVVTILPVLVAYPFLQKYFIKGMLIGAIKG